MAMELAHTPPAAAADHSALMAALDGGDLAGDELARARAVAAACPGCAALLADLAVIRAALPAVPAPSRRRDFRLSPEDAARLRPSGWRRISGWLASPRSTVRPLATGLATLGIVGLLVGAGLPGLGVGSTASAPAEDRAAAPLAAGAATQEPGSGSDAAGSRVPAPSPPAVEGPTSGPAAAGAPASSPSLLFGANAAPSASPGAEGAGGGAPAAGSVPAPQPEPGGAAAKEAPAGTDGGASSMTIISAALLAAGLGLLAARAVAVRRAR